MEISISDVIDLDTLLPQVTVKFYLRRMSSTNWYRVDFNFTTLPLCAWIEVNIRAANKLLRFILTTGFGEEYKFINFLHEDPFIVSLYVS